MGRLIDIEGTYSAITKWFMDIGKNLLIEELDLSEETMEKRNSILRFFMLRDDFEPYKSTVGEGTELWKDVYLSICELEKDELGFLYETCLELDEETIREWVEEYVEVFPRVRG